VPEQTARALYTSPDKTIGQLFLREKTIIYFVHNITFYCADVNSSAFTLPKLARLTANDALREVNLYKNVLCPRDFSTTNITYDLREK
jgi:hypothetical protein